MAKNNKLKKKIGEKAYQYLTRNYSDDFLSEHLPKLFGLLTDIRYIAEDEYPKIKKILNLQLEEKQEQKKPTKTAKELLDEAGFDLHDNIREKKDYVVFKKYFNDDEKLCKFDSYDATSRYSRVFVITRKGFEDIERSSNPGRQDEYSTSIMTVGISLDKKNVAQITSRYNHTVSGCDNTFNSNLDNIVEGLTEAFNSDYNLEINAQQTVEFRNFYFTNKKYYHYHYEINGIKYGDNTINGVYYDPSEYLIFENLIFNIKEKHIKTFDKCEDAFVDIVNEKLKNGAKIQIQKGDIPDNQVDDENLIVFYI